MNMIRDTVGGVVHSTLEHLSTVKEDELGRCALFEDKTIGDDRYCVFSGCPNVKRVTLVLRGSSEEVLQEAHRSIHDAICVLSNVLANPSFIVGGGAVEMMLKTRIDQYCSKQSLDTQRSFAINSCVQAFGKALQHIVVTLCENGGLNVADVISELQSIHSQANDTNTNRYYGVDMERGCAGNLYEMNVFEPTSVKRNALMCACEAACLILSIDYVIKMPQEETEEQRNARVAKEYRQQQIAQRKWKETMSAQRKELA
jgi:T-complex protein 1 subunit eta